MSAGAGRWRLFAAVDVPGDVLSALDEVIEPRRSEVAGARWAPLGNQHITMKFLGGVEADDVPAVAAACLRSAEAVECSEIRVEGLGAFPNARRARVLWAGVRDDVDLLATLAARLETELAPLGFEPEGRAFTPHLTLARFRSPVDVRPLIDSTIFRSTPFLVEHLHLYRSHLSPKGARYEVVQSFVLSRGRRSNL